MTVSSLPAQPTDLAAVRDRVDAVLHEFLDAKVRTAAAGCLPAEVVQVLHGFVFAGGKRIRPLLCTVGWHAAGGHGVPEPVVRVAAALEMFHAFCLIHDDVMDNSATRRGRSTVHRALAAAYPGDDGAAADRFGAHAAILVGDLALVWADEILHTAGLTAAQLAAVMPLIAVMRTEVVFGQYLDLLATGYPGQDIEAILRIAHYKTARYTVERPLHTGAALAGADTGVRNALSAYALPIGEAFQLRDDLLGVYGSPERTGKSNLDDLCEGKATVLLALAHKRATPDQLALLHALVGRTDLAEEHAAQIRTVPGSHRRPRHSRAHDPHPPRAGPARP
ncbi:polyprenyl synthetase family protein [Streptomyces spectabilis]|uniref:Geranylgeranyl diphosphate synthase type I n=1 Tax=Streptomyces spectabilis TaxID=68270 RepID=A0A7W8B7G2_STRST|nr:polyprenyl synthetase family protein [Streptomyces spectabilis]MBB5109958.1 geranylgeranyl diphosphate synthase type I [Streptomyces spectabilis]